MASFSDQIKALVGEASLAGFADNIALWLNDAALSVALDLIARRPALAGFFSVSVNYTSPGVVISNPHIISVSRFSASLSRLVEAREIPASEQALASVAGNFYSANEFYPAYCIDDGSTLRIFPSGGTSHKVYAVGVGTVNDAAGTVSPYMAGALRLIPVWVAMRVVEVVLQDKRAAIPSIETELATIKSRIGSGFTEAGVGVIPQIDDEHDSELAGLKQSATIGRATTDLSVEASRLQSALQVLQSDANQLRALQTGLRAQYEEGLASLSGGVR